MALLLAVAGTVLLATPPDAAAQAGRGAQLAAVCAACHRMDGLDEGIPTIAGVHKATLIEALQAFKSGARKSQIMQVIARSLTTEDIAVLADYLSTQKKGAQRP